MSDTLLVSTRKGLFTVSRREGHGRLPRVDFLGDNVSLTLADARDGRRYAALDHGHFGVKLHRSTRLARWEEIAAPTYPPKPEGYEETDMWGRPLDWSTARIWALAAGRRRRARRHLVRHAAGRSVPLERSRAELGDDATRFGTTPSASSGSAAAPTSRHPFDLRRPARCAARLGRSVDAAASGAPRTAARAGRNAAKACAPNTCRRSRPTTRSPRTSHRLVQCPAAPERMWVQHHNGIFVSSDEGRTLTEVTDVEPRCSDSRSPCIRASPTPHGSFPAIKDEKRIPRDGQLVVTRTRDGGKSFDILTNGLPQHTPTTSSTAMRSRRRDGDRLAFGSTTGGLWVSEDQGESWVCVTHTLPPVYAVQFG